jgi:hypothetical protein
MNDETERLWHIHVDISTVTFYTFDLYLELVFFFNTGFCMFWPKVAILMSYIYFVMKLLYNTVLL